MAGSKLTFVAEFVDRLTGPTKKAQKAVEDLGKATESAARKSQQANTKAERAERKRSKAALISSELEIKSANRRAWAKENAARRSKQADKVVEVSERKRSATVAKTGTVIERNLKKQTALVKDYGSAHVQASQRVRRALGVDSGKHQAAADRIKSSIGNASKAYDSFARKQADSKRTSSIIAQMAGRNSSNFGLLGKQIKQADDAITQMAGRSANGVNLLGRSMDGLRPDKMASRYNNSLNKMLGRTEQVASKIRSSLQRAGDTDFVRYGSMAATAAGGFAAAGGLRRIADVQQADVVLETMGITGGDKDNLMGQFKGLAQDTPFSTGSISMLGAGLISSGMEQSKVESSVQGAIDTAALFGMSLEDMALPLKQMQAKGVLQGDDLNQLTDRNIPMEEWLSKQKGVDRSEIKNMVSKGQISADDVFQALAANSKGGAEKASKTLRGSFTNMLSAGGQLGEAFFLPMLPELTEALQSAKTTLQGLKPELQVMGKFVGLLVKGLAPFLPIIIPGLIALGGALIGLKVASTVAAGVQALAAGAGFLSQKMGGPRGAASVMGWFSKETKYAQSDVQSLAGQSGLGGMNERLRDSTKNMSRAERATRGLGKAFGVAAGLAAGLGAASAAMQFTSPGGIAEGKLDNAISTGGASTDQAFKDAAWANGNDGFVSGILNGSLKNVENAGDAAAQVSKSRTDPVGRVFQGVNDFFGGTNAVSLARDDLSSMDSSLAALVQNGDKASAGSQFNTLVGQAEAKGAKAGDIAKLFPQYRDSVYGAFTDAGSTPDDNAVLQAMRSGQGFRSGGYTGDGPASALAGAVHGREYVMPERVTSRPGNLAALREIHRTGEVPRSYHGGDSTQVSVSVDARGATAEAANAVGASVAREVRREMERIRRQQSNQHGNRALRGAN